MLPIKKVIGDKFCFIPCGSLDPETNCVPEWCKSYNLKEIIPDIQCMDLYNIRKPGARKITTVNKTDYTSITSNQANEGDLLLCWGQWMEAYAYGDDAFYKEGKHDIVRFTKNFTNGLCWVLLLIYTKQI